MEPYELTISRAREMLDKKELTSAQLTQSVLDRIAAVDPKVGAFLTPTPELAMVQAKAADEKLAAGETGPLLGIPLALKDVLCTRGVRTTCASRILENFVPPYDATVVARLKQAGAVIVGKVSMDEFAMGSSNENSAFGPVKNPWDLSRIPGGSSGGSAAAVSADMCLAALGSDTGGSIRQPASHCGVVGAKPTYGRVSRFGLVAFASSLDQVGPLTKSVEDAAILMNAVCGYDPADSTSVDQEVPDFTAAVDQGAKGLKVGVVPSMMEGEGLDPEVQNFVKGAAHALADQGAEMVEVELPHAEYCVAVYYIIAPAEASSNLARYDGVKYGFRDKEQAELIKMYHASRSAGFGKEVQRRILIGTYALSAGYYDAYYGKALQVRTLIVQDFQKAFEQCDVILSPVSPAPAWKIGEKQSDPLAVYLSDIYTISANLAGIPGMSVPCGFSSGGLPIGAQFLAGHFQEEKMVRAAGALEKALAGTISGRRPQL